MFSETHMEYHNHTDGAGEPTLAEMTEKAIQILQKNPNGFILLVEGEFVDACVVVNRFYSGKIHINSLDVIISNKIIIHS